MQTTIRLKDELLRRAKQKAAREGRSLTSLSEEGLPSALTGNNSASSRRKPLPVSKRKGGLLGGVDVNSNASLADLLDEEGEWISRT